MRVLRTIAEVRRVLAPHRRSGGVGFVPTMGALHSGHATLFTTAKRDCAFVVASVFVNPTQFNDPKDLAAYPRQEERDAEIAAEAGVDVLFAPAVGEMYPANGATSIAVAGPALAFEGAHRPGHFDGVAIVCVKLFGIVQPTHAYFGQKDAQQVAVLKRVIADLALPLSLCVVPTVREADGLALSSRNVRLSRDDRARAAAIPRALRAGLAAYAQGSDVSAAARTALAGLEVEYAEVTTFDGHPTLVIAARAGETRLIDNVPLDQPALAGISDA